MFNEFNTTEQMILDPVNKSGVAELLVLCEHSPDFRKSLGGEPHQVCQDHVTAAQLTVQNGEMMLESWIREALLPLNPDIPAYPYVPNKVINTLHASKLSKQ